MIRRAQPSPELTLERLEFDSCDWTEMDSYADREVFQTRQWLEFVRRTQGAEPVVAAIRREGETVGYFTGGMIRRLGVRMLGSPFPGWTTLTLGFNLRQGTNRRDALAAMVRFAWRELGCIHVEIRDRRLAPGDLKANGFRCYPYPTFELDLAPEEEELFAGMSSACRRAIRKGVKEGVTVEPASAEGFAEEYYAQLVEVFAKQGLKPPYDAERVRELISCLEPSGLVLLLRALGPDGERIATGIFPAMNRTGWFWGGASRRSHEILRPNEAIFWFAIRSLRERGMTRLDAGGGGDYKRKYGVCEAMIPMGSRARAPGLVRLRDLAASASARAAFGGRP